MQKIPSQIDNLTRSDHSFLEEKDQCYFFGEYTAHEGYGFSETNQLIYNFKKCVSLKQELQYQYKTKAIGQIAELLDVIAPEKATIIPVPPSKHSSDPLFDDRLMKALTLFNRKKGGTADVRDLVLQKASTEASHLCTERPSIEELVDLYEVQTHLLGREKEFIIIFDDMLTTGRHFKAMQRVLTKYFPDKPIIGLFVARRAIPPQPAMLIEY